MKTLTKTFTVSAEDTAKVIGSGSLDVLATPIMSAWMENTAMNLASENLNSEDTTVGIMINIQHTKASAIGETITCTANETATDGRKLSYSIECKDSKGNLIGSAIHERFIVNVDRFMKKVQG